MPRKSFVIFFGIFLILYNAISFFAFTAFVRPEFDRLQEMKAVDVMNIVQMTIIEEAAALKTRVKDWAPWDDTYQFVQTLDRGYIHRNLSPETLENLDLDLMLFLDRTGNAVWSHVAGQAEMADLSESAIARIVSLAVGGESDEGVSGIFQLSDTTLYIIAAHPILTSERQGPPAGTVIFGWALDPSGVERIRRPLAIDFDIRLVSPDTDEWRITRQIESAADGMVLESNSTRHYAYSLLQNLDGDAVALVEILSNRDIVNRGSSTIRTVMAVLGSFGIVSFLALFLFFRKHGYVRQRSS